MKGIPFLGGLLVLTFLFSCGKEEPLRPAGGDLSEKTRERSGVPAEQTGPIRIVFITDGLSRTVPETRIGFNRAQAEFPNIRMEFVVPETGTVEEQKQIIEKMLSEGVRGIALNPIDPREMTDFLNQVSSKAVLVTQGTDAPESNRSCHVGFHDLDSGRFTGLVMKSLLGQTGGDVYVLAERNEQHETLRRLQGFREAAGENVRVVRVLTDEGDLEKARLNVESVLNSGEPVKGLVGLSSHNGVAIVRALREQERWQGDDKVAAVVFGMDEEILQAVKEGIVFATMVTRPDETGYQSMRILANLVLGNPDALQGLSDNIRNTGAMIRQDNVDAFRGNLQRVGEP